MKAELGCGGDAALQCDVLVVGSGLAGLCAALEAGRAGARVALASAGPLCSGSSFYGGTWGMGLIGPRDAGDEDDLVRTILQVGCGAADPGLVRVLVEGIRPGIAWLEELGAELRRPSSSEAAREAAYIPCFDAKPRLWRGLEHISLGCALPRELGRLGAEELLGCELVDLLQEPGGPVRGAVLYDGRAGGFVRVGCGAVVLACGGSSGLFERRLAAGDVLGSAAGIALAHGAGLVNAEFIQLMPGLVEPAYGVVFNEKTFRYLDAEASGLPAGLLEARSGHGPFTTRLGDAAVDMAIDAAGAEGLPVRYRAGTGPQPEFVRDFASWLEREHGVGAGDELRLALFAQASNGGIRIDADGATGVPGLFACGEAAGGMHGADRLGGLSSANCLVFGRRAGAAAARSAAQAPAGGELPAAACAEAAGPALPAEQAGALTGALRRTMTAHCMLNRSEQGLARALAAIDEFRQQVEDAGTAGDGPCDAAARARALRLRAQLVHARAVVAAMCARTKSCGPHHRAD